MAPSVHGITCPFKLPSHHLHTGNLQVSPEPGFCPSQLPAEPFPWLSHPACTHSTFRLGLVVFSSPNMLFFLRCPQSWKDVVCLPGLYFPLLWQEPPCFFGIHLFPS